MKNSADLGGCHPSRPSASVDNTLLHLQNSSYPTQPHSIIAKYFFINKGECFITVSKHEKTDNSTGPKAKCFYCFRVFGNPDETWSPRLCFSRRPSIITINTKTQRPCKKTVIFFCFISTCTEFLGPVQTPSFSWAELNSNLDRPK